MEKWISDSFAKANEDANDRLYTLIAKKIANRFMEVKDYMFNYIANHGNESISSKLEDLLNCYEGRTILLDVFIFGFKEGEIDAGWVQDEIPE